MGMQKPLFKELLFRGQSRRKGEKVRIGDGAPVPGAWQYGPGVMQGIGDFSIIYTDKPEKVVVYTDTLGQFSGFTDQNSHKIFTQDIVDFLGHIGVVDMYKGSFGIAFDDDIDWDEIEGKIPEITCCDNALTAVLDDHFISFWEISNNFNEGDKELSTVKVIGNIQDNAELLNCP